MVWKKVTNSDAGDSTHFGGDDVDKISLTFNAETQTDPINIKDENLLIVDPADTSKKVRFDAVGISTSTTRVLTLPNADVTLASTAVSSTSVAGLMSSAQFDKLDLIEASATADQTGAQIKTAYQSEANAFTDTLFTKLGNIETAADVTDTTNVNAAAATTVGTITSGTWQGTTVAVNQGGTGVTSSTGTGSTVLSASPTLTGTLNAAAITLSGNLIVNGTSTTVDTATLTVEDPLIKLASGNNAADSVDVGFYGLYDVGGTDKYAGIVRDASDSGKFIAFKDLQTEPTTTVDKTATGYTKAIIVADIEGDVTGAVTGNATGLSATLAVASGGTGVTAKTGTGNVVLSSSPTLVTPALGTPSALVLTNATGTLTSTTLVTPALGTPSAGVLTNCTALPAAQVTAGTMQSGMVMVAPVLGTPASGVLTNCTALPAAQVAQGTMASGMVLVAPALGTPASGALTNCTALPAAQVSQGTMASGMVLVAPALGTPASGVLSSCTALPAAQVTAGTMVTGHTIPDATLTFSINAQVGTTYTPVLADAGKIVTLNNGSAITLTIPPNSSVAYPVGSSLTFINIGAGLTTFAQGSGVTIASSGGTATAPSITAQHNSATCIKIATDTWQVIGAIE